MTTLVANAPDAKPPVAIAKVDHTGITVSSLVDALDFWVGVLGFQHLHTWKVETTPFVENLPGAKGGDMSVAMVEGYGHRLELLECPAQAGSTVLRPPACAIGSVHIGLYVVDIDLALARAAEAGWIEATEPQIIAVGERGDMRLIYLRGPDGITIEFMQKPPERRLSPYDGGTPRVTMLKGGLSPRQKARAEAILAANFASDISLGDVASQCGLSRAHFARAFRQTAGIPPHQWLLHYRVDRAKAMMLNSSLNIGDVAIACGFTDQSHLTRVFTRKIGLSPGAWRRENRINLCEA